ncbi:sensor domain-containing diguanylate cyclase [Bowmanella dokdonensis]|uniref:diguanylate cyclase n=1 Tax=Bowmanella dokdonensis TaxID=751969 RepID=A0A939ISQ3_9ALTE|nr:diguanylate cyclase [Bowmanella dokdonensis]MBN7827429.1 diguanylate cyclase [Bowmanella dokdonensis]
MTSVNLRDLIKRSYLKSVLIPLLIVESALLGMYFTVTYLITQQNMDLALSQAKENLQIITRQQATNLDLHLREIERNAFLLQSQITDLFAENAPALAEPVKQQYRLHTNGSFYKAAPMPGGALYLSARYEINSQRKQKAYWSERLDPLLIGITDINPVVVQSYFNSWDSMVRLYPPIPNLPEVFGARVDIRQQPFYYLADEIHNPERLPTWTESYFDPLGMGWILTAMAPVYYQDMLQGVAGIDLSIARLAEQILDPELPWQASSLLLNSQGDILAMDPHINQTLGVDIVHGQEYPDLLTQPLERKDYFEVQSFRDESLKQFFGKVVAREGADAILTLSGTQYLVLSARVEQTGWQVIALVDQANLYQPALQTKKMTTSLGLLAVAGLLIFYVLFIYVAQRRSRRLSVKIAQPIQTLSRLTSNVETGREVRFETSGIEEIDQLQDNFREMSIQLDKRRQSLVESQLQSRVQQERANLMKQLSETDSLTKLYNRRKLDDILVSEIGRAGRYETPLCVIILDIDHFKHINDKFGHLKGDKVICKVAELLKQRTRQTDHVGRWGGEEFLLICPGIMLEKALQLAEKLRTTLEQQTYEEGLIVTASFGVAHFQAGDSVDTLVSRADKALYQSKQAGRNQVSLAEEDGSKEQHN